MKDKVEEMYLDYFNNFITISYFAEYYGISTEKAERIINIGRRINHSRCKDAEPVMHMLHNRFCLSYNLTNDEWWVQDRFEHLGRYTQYSDALIAIDKRMNNA
jgi:hypothetical protein